MKTMLLTPLLRSYVVGSFSVGVALGAGLVHGIAQTAPYYDSESITRAEYERIDLRMSLTEVEAILGRGIEVAQSESTIAFEWKNSDGSSMEILFEDGRMIQKSQVGL